MTTFDYAVIIVMGLAALSAAASFAVIVGYLFDRGLVDRRAGTPDIRQFYRTYRDHTRQQTGRTGRAFWVHCVSAGLFILIGVIYTLLSFILPTII